MNTHPYQNDDCSALGPDRQVLHFYCDESCHLPADGESNMLLGLLASPAEQVAAAHASLRTIATSGGFEPHFEAKWTKLSPARLLFSDIMRPVLEWFIASSAHISTMTGGNGNNSAKNMPTKNPEKNEAPAVAEAYLLLHMADGL